jgi:hypothetical protein
MESLPDPMLTATANHVPLVPFGVESTLAPCPLPGAQQAIGDQLPASTEKRRACTQRVGKVLHIINGEHFSGAERVQQLLGKRLGDRDSRPSSPASNWANSPTIVHCGLIRSRNAHAASLRLACRPGIGASCDR